MCDILQFSSNLQVLDFSLINTDEAQDLYCDGDKCEIILTPHMPEQRELEVEDEPAEITAEEENEVAQV